MTEQPPGDPYGRPTEPLPPRGTPPVTREEVVVDDYPMTKAELAERIDRTRFWSQFGAAAGTLAAILSVIAIVLALQAKDDADNASSGSSNAGVRSEVNQLQDDVNTLQRQQSEDSQALDDLQDDVSSIERRVGNASDAGPSQDAFDQLQQQVSDLSDTVDQLQRDLESASGGDGGSP